MPHAQPGAWFDESPRIEGRWVGWVSALVLVIAGGASIVCVGGMLGAIVMISRGGLTAGVDSITGDAMAVTFFGGFGAFLVAGLTLAYALGWRPAHAFALRKPPLAALGLALVGGLIVGVFPGWIADQIVHTFPSLQNQGSLELIARLLMGGSWMDSAFTLTTIVVGAPLLEELCFRGALWGSLERALPGHQGQALALVITSLAFVAAHLDPVQSPALLPTAFFFGALRWSSGSIWPSIVAHFVNNALAAGLTYAMLSGDGAAAETSTPLWLGMLGLVLTIGVTLALFPLRRKPAAMPDTWRPVRSRPEPTAP